MPRILPLRGLRYTPGAGPLGELLAPPYDVVSAGDARALASRNPHNAILLEAAEGGEERYDRVAGLLQRWQYQGILHREDEPALYVYEQEFQEGARSLKRRALIAGVEARPWEEGAVRPHEFTMSGPKEDRLRLLEATRTQLSPVFMIARDRSGQLAGLLESTIAAGPPAVEGTTPDGDHHRLWVLEAGRYELRQLAPLLSETFYIADGHHRYETAVEYGRRTAESGGDLPGDHPARFAMTAIVPASDPGLVIRPIHRLVPRRAPAGWRERLEEYFAIDHLEPVGELPERTRQLSLLLAQEPPTVVAVGLDPGQWHGLRLRSPEALAGAIPPGHSQEWGCILPNVLRYGVLEPLWGISDEDLRAGAVEYTHEAGAVLEAEASNPRLTGFLLPPCTIQEVMLLADQGERMPQKSTFFHPKLATGMVFHPLEP
jgi:uncharacterized protein (DUF1015 family)